MSVKKDASGRRSVQAEVEVPGTPEEVWQAIATGPGISSWFVPSEIEEREGGAVVCHFGPGTSMDSVSTIKVWDPPHRFAAESQDLGPDAPPVASEWIVEARSGGTCVVRVVHSLFTSADDWDNQMEEWEAGWPDFFRILRLYLTHFRGQRCSPLQVGGSAAVPKPEAWATLTRSLGLVGATVSQRVRTLAGAPTLAGLVERVGEDPYPEELLLRLDEPVPGIAHLFAIEISGQVYLSIRMYLYGGQASAVVARDESLWQSWMNEYFPSDGKDVEQSS
jgi:uncharacterized protein YndB with AHSA1/START domain